MRKSYRVHRPSKSGGCAAEFQIKEPRGKYDDYCVMLQIVPQEGVDEDTKNAKFAWSREGGYKGITMKLGLADIGEMLAVLNMVKPAAGTGKGLYHQNDSGNSVLKFDGSEKGIALSMSAKRGEEEPVRFNMLLSHADAQIVKALFEKCLSLQYDERVDAFSNA